MTEEKIIELLAYYSYSDYASWSSEEVRIKHPGSWENRLERAKRWLEFEKNPTYYIRRFNPDQKYLCHEDKWDNNKEIIRQFKTLKEAQDKIEELTKARKRFEKNHMYTIDKSIHNYP